MILLGNNNSIVRVSRKVFRISRTMLFVICWSAVRSILTLDSNFKYMATKVPFEAGDYLIFRPKVDRWVDSTQCDYGGLNRKKGTKLIFRPNKTIRDAQLAIVGVNECCMSLIYSSQLQQLVCWLFVRGRLVLA